MTSKGLEPLSVIWVIGVEQRVATLEKGLRLFRKGGTPFRKGEHISFIWKLRSFWGGDLEPFQQSQWS